MLNRLIPVMAGILVFFLLQATYWTFFDEGDYIDWGTTATVEKKQHKAGDLIFVERTVTVREDVYVDFDRRLAEIECEKKCRQYDLPLSSRAYQKNKVYAINRGIEIPRETLPGKYVYDVVATWRVNPLKYKTVQLPSVEIEIIG